jgi:FkbM family methyltransferase
MADVELFPGIRVTLDFADLTQFHTYWQGSRYEVPTPEVLADLGRGSVTHFFDIGANYGFYSYWMLYRCPGIEVHLFEPNPISLSVAEEAKRRNSLQRLHLHEVGLSDERARLPLHLGREDSGHATFGPHPVLGAGPSTEAVLLSFDEWLDEQRIAPPAQPEWLAKVDVEGLELSVLRGMRRALEARAFRALAIELNEYTLSFCGTSAAEVTDYLAGAGYEPLAARPEGRQWPLHQTWNAFFVPGAG